MLSWTFDYARETERERVEEVRERERVASLIIVQKNLEIK